MQLKFVSFGLIATALMVNAATIGANKNTVGVTNVGTSNLDHLRLSNLAGNINGRVASRKRSLVSPKKIAEAIRRRGEEADEEEADEEEVDEEEVDEDEADEDEDEVDEDEIDEEEVDEEEVDEDEDEVDEDEVDEDKEEVDEDEVDEDEDEDEVDEDEVDENEEEDLEMKRRGLTDTLPLGLLGGKKKN